MPEAPCAGQWDLMFDPSREAEAIALCNSGCFAFEACRRVGATEEYGVWGGEPAGGAPVSRLRPLRARAVDLLRSGLRNVDVARETGLSSRTVERIRAELRSAA
ncbi:hypothetical protein FrEUN1fDRAFT_0400 [Parafrankia sp. EUN1f]|nr:hypothetical protein FrEUN1fDRAFT_0400 [Parafrankia sp. EUN1f]